MKKIIFKIIIMCLFAVFSYIFLKNIILPIIIMTLYLLILVFKKNEIQKKEKKEKDQKEYEFSNMLSYLLVFLENNFNVYQSLQLTINYIKEILVNDVEQLINEIDVDKSITPYQNFANKFDSNLIYQVVMMIYQLDINGYDVKYLNNFPRLINNLRQIKIENMISSRKMNMSFMTIVPIIALLIVVFVMIFYILMLVGEFN